MPLYSISSYGALSTSGISSPSFHYSAGGKAVCVSGIVDVPVVASAVNVLYKGPDNNYELTEFITDFLRVGSNTLVRYTGSQTSISDTFSVYSKLCVPADKDKVRSLTSIQFLTHGGTTDNSYWDFADGYSYVDTAALQGYATFSYDRLGTGKSEHPDPYQVVQAPLQVELAHALIRKLKGGHLGNLVFNKIIGVGHSLGSALTQGISSSHPEDFNAVVLTGHSGFTGGAGTGFAAAAQQIANTFVDRPEFKHLPNGYFTLGPGHQTLQFAFFYYPHFDPKIFLQGYNTRQTNAIGETLTLGNIYMPATAFKKPVLILNGQQDYFYCQGNCLATGDVTAQAMAIFFPNAPSNQSQAITLPNFGHNLNLHLGRQKVFEKMLDFISGLGIKP
ncbi:alpha/beta-hydrolase [Lindgomyces ingoldianus]|uniref:Alpha/beta-hydrolase n=1 Tax=Lindgomyces ingoldianus TaxID=673940 RepID=A0ACB6Q6K5_9PLEO|nr:alpha/beta-hydrolase [Lindgomyces ingoldianus]KAF2462569.1 alpha/beta-hydrolase [Lindgomyces ingoldianus]